MRKGRNIWKRWLLIALVASLSGCYPDESLNIPEKDNDVTLTELDEYIEEHFTEEYDMAIRYRYVDRYVATGERVTPPRLEVVRPMLDFIEKYWIDPYLEVSNGEVFFLSLIHISEPTRPY